MSATTLDDPVRRPPTGRADTADAAASAHIAEPARRASTRSTQR